MKVIFIEDVPDVALAGEAKEVADGYGRNYLLPRKLAVLANSAASNVVKAQLKKVAVKRAQAEAEMTEVAGKLNGMEITITAKVGEKGRLYGSITSADIAGELGSSAGVVVDKRKVELEEPIRELGSYEVTIRFTHDITATIKLAVVSDKVAAVSDKVAAVSDKVAVEEEETKEEPKEEKKAKAKTKKKTAAKVEEVKVEEAEAEVSVEATEVKVEEAGDKETGTGE